LSNEAQDNIDKNFKWFILFQLWLIYFALGMIAASLSPLITPITNELNLSHSQMGIILGSIHLTYIPLAIPIGLLIDKIGIRKSILIGSIIISLSGILRSYANSFETFFLSVGLMGLGGPTVSVGIPKAVALWFVGEDRGKASGLYFTGFIMGIASATAITNKYILLITGSWRGALAFYGFFGFLVSFIWLLFGREKSQPRHVIGESKVSILKGIKVLLNDRNIWLVAIIGFSSFYVRHSLGGWLPKFFEMRDMSPEKAGFLASIPNWFGLIGSLAIPRFDNKKSRKNIISAVLLVQGICIVIMGTMSGPLLSIALVLYGLSTYAILPLLMVTLMGLPKVGVQYMGVAVGLFFTIGEIGGFIGPSIMGYILDLTGSILPSIITLFAVVEIMIIFTYFLKLDDTHT
jgi:cyanate permease